MKKSVSKSVLIIEQFISSLISEIVFFIAGSVVGGSLGAYYFFPIGDEVGWEGLAVILGGVGICVGGLVGVLIINRLHNVKINNIYLYIMTLVLAVLALVGYSIVGAMPLSVFFVPPVMFTLFSNLSFVKIIDKKNDTELTKERINMLVVIIKQFISILISEFIFYFIGLIIGSDWYFSIGDAAVREKFWITLGVAALCLGGLVGLLIINGLLDFKIKNFIIYILSITLIVWWFGHGERWDGFGVVLGNTGLCFGGLFGTVIINRLLDVKINNLYLYISTFVLIILWLGLFLFIGSKLPLSVVFIFTSTIFTIVSNLTLARRKIS